MYGERHIVKSLKIKNRVYFTFQIFEDFPNLLAVVTSRTGGVSQHVYSSLNLGFHVNDNQKNVVQNRLLVASDLEFDISNLVCAQQVHSSHIANAADTSEVLADFSHQVSKSDGLYTDKPGIPLLILTADCAPVFLFDPEKKVIAVLHVGWKGVMHTIVPEALKKLNQVFDVEAKNIRVGVGPCLGVDDYQVQKDLVDLFKQTFPNDFNSFFKKADNKIYFDLEKAIRWQLVSHGVPQTQIEFSGISTASNLEHFYSHRAEHNKTGRFGSIILLKS